MNIKNYINKKTIFSLIAITLFLLIMGSYTKASAQEDIQKKVTIVSKNNDGTLGGFSAKDGFWYPGRTLEKQFSIRNGNNNEIEFDKISVNIQSVSNFALNKVFNPDEEIYREFLKNLKVQLKEGDKVLFDGTFQDFNDKGVLLNTPIKIKSNSEDDLLLKIHFQEEAGNMFEDLQNLFNLNIQYISKDGAAVSGDITTLPHTGSVYNFITLVVIGLLLSGIGFLILGYREETSLKKGGK
jgi:LPXTG-motif cell wall-anchored protein